MQSGHEELIEMLSQYFRETTNKMNEELSIFVNGTIDNIIDRVDCSHFRCTATHGVGCLFPVADNENYLTVPWLCNVTTVSILLSPDFPAEVSLYDGMASILQ